MTAPTLAPTNASTNASTLSTLAPANAPTNASTATPTGTRRQLVVAALAAAGAGVLAPVAALAVDAGKPAPSDAELIADLYDLELLVLFVYGLALGGRELPGRARRVIGEIAAHERAHIAALARELPGLGAAAAPGPASIRAAEAALASHHVVADLRRRRRAKDWIKLLGDVEDVLERNYHLAISLLRRSALIELCAQIMASEAQHSALLATLRQRDIRKALPNAFVNGG